MMFISLISSIVVSLFWFAAWQWRKKRWLNVIKRLREQQHQTYHGLICQHERASLTENRLIKEEAENSRLRAVIRELRRHKRFIES